MKKANLILDNIPYAKDKFNLEICIGSGIFGKVYKASDNEENNKKVAIKTVIIQNDILTYLNEEYNILKELSTHFNLPDFYGCFKAERNGNEEIWFVMEVSSLQLTKRKRKKQIQHFHCTLSYNLNF